MFQILLRRYRYIAFSLLSIAAAPSALAQDEDFGKSNFSKNNLVKLSGFVSADAIAQTGNTETGRQPVTTYLSGNINARVFNLIDLPFSFFISNERFGKNYPTLPSRLSVNPSYKWAKFQIGTVSKTFSPYTLNGRLFTGVGVDLAPPKTHLSLSAMYGRLQKAANYDAENRSIKAAFKRMGYGLKAAYTRDRWSIGYTVFGAKDDPNSIRPVPDSIRIKPMQNVVMSVQGSVKILKNLVLAGEYASSALTTNSADSFRAVPSAKKEFMSSFIRENISTNYYHAMNTSLMYRIKNTTIGLKYERIDPGYLTLGSYYFNQDIVNYTITGAQQIGSKLDMNGSFGWQHDNLDKTKSKTNKRKVGDLSLNYIPNENLVFTATYSNFTTFMFINPQYAQPTLQQPYQNFDTLNFSQLSQNAMVMVNAVVATKERTTDAINASFNYFDVVNYQEGIAMELGSSKFYNAMAAYTRRYTKQNIMASLGVNSNYTTGFSDMLMAGPMGSVSAAMLKKKANASFSTSYMTTLGNTLQPASFLNSRVSFSWSFHKKHNLSASISNQLRYTDAGQSQLSLYTIGYRLNF